MFFKKQAVKLKKYLRKTLYFIYLIIWINFTIIVVLVLRFAICDLRGARWETEDVRRKTPVYGLRSSTKKGEETRLIASPLPFFANC